MSPGAPAPVTVAVVSWNARELLARCLRSLEPDAEAGRAEVWVVDNASADGTPEMVREDFPWVSLVASQSNLGYGRAINLVADRTDSSWIAAANQDLRLHPGALVRMIEAGESRPQAGVVAPRLLGPDGSTQQSVHSFPTIPLSLAYNSGLTALVPRLGDRLCISGRWDSDRGRAVPWAIAAFWLIRRSAFDAVGGFDPEQWLHAEDLDLAWRLREAGWWTWYEPSAAVDHVGSVSVREAFGELVESRFAAAGYAWIARRFGVRRARSVAALNAAGAAARLASLAPLARLWPARFGARAAALRGWLEIHLDSLRAPRSELLRRH